jgi:hypothetical protein
MSEERSKLLQSLWESLSQDFKVKIRVQHRSKTVCISLVRCNEILKCPFLCVAVFVGALSDDLLQKVGRSKIWLLIKC